MNQTGGQNERAREIERDCYQRTITSTRREHSQYTFRDCALNLADYGIK